MCKVTCSCGKAYKVSDDSIGKKLKCTSCGEKVLVDPLKGKAKDAANATAKQAKEGFNKFSDLCNTSSVNLYDWLIAGLLLMAGMGMLGPWEVYRSSAGEISYYGYSYTVGYVYGIAVIGAFATNLAVFSGLRANVFYVLRMLALVVAFGSLMLTRIQSPSFTLILCAVLCIAVFVLSSVSYANDKSGAQ